MAHEGGPSHRLRYARPLLYSQVSGRQAASGQHGRGLRLRCTGWPRNHSCYVGRSGAFAKVVNLLGGAR